MSRREKYWLICIYPKSDETLEDAKLLNQMESMRERADYDAIFMANEQIINDKFDLVVGMIQKIKELTFRERH